jgi:hypothetical protein
MACVTAGGALTIAGPFLFTPWGLRVEWRVVWLAGNHAPSCCGQLGCWTSSFQPSWLEAVLCTIFGLNMLCCGLDSPQTNGVKKFYKASQLWGVIKIGGA